MSINNIRGKYPFVNVTIRIFDKSQIDFVDITEICWIDTGFDGGLFFPTHHMANLKLIKLNLPDTSIRLGGNTPAVGKICAGSVMSINDHNFGINDVVTPILFHGNDRHGLLGLNLLNRWISNFSGPSQTLTISF